MKRILLYFISFVCVFGVNAQEYRVKSFEIVPKDMDARMAGTPVDGNGKKCALLKIYAGDRIASVRGNKIGEVKTTGMEKAIWMMHDSKEVELIFENHYPLRIRFEDFDYPTITSQMVYVVKLEEKGGETPTSEGNVSKIEQPKEDEIFVAVEQAAEFPGGLQALYKWLGMNIRYPESAWVESIQGRVVVQFVIEKDGTISNASILKSVNEELDQEALRVVRTMPKWKPGMNNGVVARCHYNLPIQFKIQDPE